MAYQVVLILPFGAGFDHGSAYHRTFFCHRKRFAYAKISMVILNNIQHIFSKITWKII